MGILVEVHLQAVVRHVTAAAACAFSFCFCFRAAMLDPALSALPPPSPGAERANVELLTSGLLTSEGLLTSGLLTSGLLTSGFGMLEMIWSCRTFFEAHQAADPP